MLIGSNSFRWFQYYQARGAKLEDHVEDVLAALARAGIEAWEPNGLVSDAAATQLGAMLRHYGLSMPSLYVGCRLHDDTWQASSDAAVAQVARAVQLGTRLICTNPDPIAWASSDDKNDSQLQVQAERLARLAERVQAEGARMVYHFHAPEFRQGAREVHHMLQNVPAALLGLCLDVHWAYRGCGNSNLAMRDLLHMYGDRIASLHLRQSHAGVWSEVLEAGDVDYTPVVTALKASNFTGPLVVELGYEAGTPETMPLEEAHRRSAAWVRQTFG